MNPQSVFCPNNACAARGQVGEGNIHVHSQKDRRYKCNVCGQTFAETKGTPYYRLRSAQETVTVVITLLAYGCPLQAIVAAFGVDERTVQAWQSRAGRHCQQIHEHLVEQPRDLGQVQADELRVKRQGGIVWMALALQVSTRLWLGGVISAQRNMGLIVRLIFRPPVSFISGSARPMDGCNRLSDDRVHGISMDLGFRMDAMPIAPAALSCFQRSPAEE